MKDQVLVPIGIAARRLDISRERLRTLADAGRVDVIRDSTGRRFLEQRELDRLLRERGKTSQAGISTPR